MKEAISKSKHEYLARWVQGIQIGLMAKDLAKRSFQFGCCARWVL